MRINNNITALNSHRQYGINNGNISKNMEKLSSGFRVNRAGDDAAGLAISEKMRAQIRGLNMASKNSQDAISMVQTAEGGMQTIQNILQRMRELAVQSGSDTNETKIDRGALNLELDQLIKEVDAIADTTEFNKMKLLNGNFERDVNGNIVKNTQYPLGVPVNTPDVMTVNPGLTIQTGANMGQTMTIKIAEMNATALNVRFDANIKHDSPVPVGPGPVAAPGSISIATGYAARQAIQIIDTAINSVSTARANLGAMQNRLEFKIQNLDNQAENIAASESRIRDADMAKMMTEFTKNSILFQASTAMLAQANSLPQGVLQLLG